MINLAVGSAEEIRGRPGILTRKGTFGHALYGPYEHIQPGDYVVGFHVETVGDKAPRDRDLVAVIDVSSHTGQRILARREIRGSDLAAGFASFAISFTVPEPCRAEYRIWVSGKAALRIEDNHVALRVTDGMSPSELIEDNAFPEQAARAIPFFANHEGELRSLHDKGMAVKIVDGAVRIVAPGNISLNLHTDDDLNFIGELFLENAYNIRSAVPACIIDIGMNVGLASLQFATKSFVSEIHSFEPFPETYARAIANLNLNPTLKAKVKPYPCGLSDADYDGPIAVADHGCSGAMTTVGVQGGTAVQLSLRDAGTFLAPIIEDARSRGLDIVMKVDCEGAEFAVFESLSRANLLTQIRAFLVEWHAMFDDKTQNTLLAPLEEAGFVAFDRSPPNSNGFFYAVRIDR